MSDLLKRREIMALAVARAQVKRGESVTPNVFAVLVRSLDRLAKGVSVPWCDPHERPMVLCDSGDFYAPRYGKCRLEEPQAVYRIELP